MESQARRWARAACRLAKHGERAAPEVASYQYLLAGVVAARLRTLRRRRPDLHLRFLLACDVQGAQPFDDLVVHLRWDYQGRRRLLTYFILLHPQASDTALDIPGSYEAFNATVKTVKQTPEEAVTPTQRLLKEWYREDLRLVIVTSSRVETTNAPAQTDFPFEGIFHTGCGERAFFGKTDEGVWNARGDGLAAEEYRGQFLRRLCVFSEQADADCLGRQLGFALEDALGGTPLHAPETPTRYTTFLKAWFENDAGDCISEESSEIEEIVRKEVHEPLKSLRFEPRYYADLWDRLRDCDTSYAVVPGIPQEVRASLFRPVLEEAQPDRYVILTQKMLKYHPLTVLESLCFRLCDEVILVVDDLDENLRTFVERLVADTKCRIRILSSEWNAGFYELLAARETECNYWSERWTLAQLLGDEQNVLLGRQVSFQGLEMALADLEGTWPALRAGVRGAALGALAVGDPLVLGTPLPVADEHFLPRIVQHHNVLLRDVFQFSSTKDHFFLSGFPEDILKDVRDPKSAWTECVNPWLITDAHNVEQACKTTWSEWDRGASVNALKWIAGKNMHWLTYDGEDIIWNNTDGDSRSLGKFIDRKSPKCDDVPLCSHEDPRDFLEWKDKTMLLADDPGFGKSTFVKYMAQVIREARKPHWVVVWRINEGRTLEILPEEIQRTHFFHVFKKAVGTALHPSSDTANLFLKESFDRIGNISVLVDGIDEVTLELKQKALHVVKELRRELDKYGSQLFLVSKSATSQDITHKFKCCPSLSLGALTSRDQLMYLLRRWRVCIENDDEHEVEERMSMLVDTIKEATVTDGLGICDIPLYMRMLTEAYMNDIEILLHEDISDIASHVNKSAVCKRYVRRNLNVICYNGGISLSDLLTLDISVDDSIVKKHTLYAAMECFANKQWLCSHYDKLQKVMIQLENAFRRGENVQTGVITEMIDGKPRFTHRTIAEYLAAMWLRENYISIPETIPAVYDGLFGDVRFFFDALLAEGYGLHEAALAGREDLLEQALAGGRHDVEEEDRGGRRALHLAAIGGRVAAARVLLRAGADTRGRDAVRRWSPLRYADDMLRFVGGDTDGDVLRVADASLAQLGVIDELLRGGAKLTDTRRVLQRKDLVLRTALEKDLAHLAEELVKRKGPVFLQKRKAADSIRLAAAHDSAKCIAMFLRRGFNVKKHLEGGTTPLHVFAGEGDVSFCMRLLKHGAAIQERTQVNEMTPLHKAAENGHVSVCNLLLDFGADVDSPNQLGVTALHMAARFGQLPVCQLLLKRGANVNAKDWNGITALRWAMRGDHYDVCRLLMDYGTDARFLDTSENSPTFRKLAAEGNMTLCRLLLDSGVAVNCKDETGVPGLHWAVRARNVRFSRALLDSGADVNAPNAKDETALHWAARAFSDDMSRFLLARGANPDIADRDGQTVLHFGARMGRESSCQLLLQHGAAPDTPDGAGLTALHHACAAGHFLVCKLLVDGGAALGAEDAHGHTPLHKAASEGREWVVKLLVERGAGVDARAASGDTPLHVAARRGRARVCRLLREYGADAQARDHDGASPHDAARAAGHDAACRELPAPDAPVTEL